MLLSQARGCGDLEKKRDVRGSQNGRWWELLLIWSVMHINSLTGTSSYYPACQMPPPLLGLSPTTAVPSSVVAPPTTRAPRCDTIAKIYTSRIFSTPSDNFTTTDAPPPPNHQPPDTLVNLGTVVSPNGFPQIDLRETSLPDDVKCCSRAFADYCCRWITEAEESVSSPTRTATHRTSRATTWQNGLLTGICFFPQVQHPQQQGSRHQDPRRTSPLPSHQEEGFSSQVW